MAAPPNTGVEKNGIPLSTAFLVPRCKVRLTPTARVPCSNAANIGERKTWTQSEFCTWQNSVRGPEPPKCIHSVPMQETAKHRAKSGWPPLSDVGAVTKPIRETRWNLLGCSKFANRSQPLAGLYTVLTIPWYCVEKILLFNTFFWIVDMCLRCEDIARQSCAMVRRWRFLRNFCVLYFQRAAHFRYAF